MSYWLISLPIQGSADSTWAQLRARTSHDADLAAAHRFALPDLRVGTLDGLMALSDDLVRVNASVEGVVNKVRRQLFDLATAGSSGGSAPADPSVNGVPPAFYLERFTWEEAKYPPRRPLGETVGLISETVGKLDDDLKVRVSEYSQLRSALAAVTRKQTGSLAVRDLGTYITKADVVETENLTTVAVVVPRAAARDFLSTYETLADFVVPRSARQVTEDSDYALFTVTLFRRVADTFRAAARAAGYQVRDVDVSPANGAPSPADAAVSLRADLDTKRGVLEAWCATAYAEAFSAWVHVCAVRLFVESVLRYGVPPNLLAALVSPRPKQGAKLRKALAGLLGDGAGARHWEADAGAGGGGEAEMYPYVSFTLNIDA